MRLFDYPFGFHTSMLYVTHEIWGDKNRNEYCGFCSVEGPSPTLGGAPRNLLSVCGEAVSYA